MRCVERFWLVSGWRTLQSAWHAPEDLDNRRLGGDRWRCSFDLQPGGCGLVDEHPVRAGHCPQLGHDGCLEGDALVESHLHVGDRFEWYCGFDQIELD